MPEPKFYNASQDYDPSLKMGNATQLFVGFIGNPLNNFEEITVKVGADVTGEWDVIWEIGEGYDAEPIPLAWVKSGVFRRRELATLLVETWFTGLREIDLIESPPFDGIMLASRTLSKGDLSKISQRVFGIDLR
jgi:hypothetical protein